MTFTEDFSTDPSANGWQVFGNASLFEWDSTNQNLRVTWDSAETNSYFHQTLGTILTPQDDFVLRFDLTFEDYAVGVTPGKPYDFPAAIGFLNLVQATQTNFSRGTGVNAIYGPQNLVEFDFFPEFDIFLPTIAQVIVSTNNAWLYNHDNLLDMPPGQLFQVAMTYNAASATLTTIVSNNAAQYGQTQTILVPTNFSFRVATFSVSSYSDQNATGSILAHGVVDNIVITTPLPPILNLTGVVTGGVWQVSFTSRSNWLYELERTTNLLSPSWMTIPPVVPGNGALLILQDTNPPPGAAFYRVRADRP